MTLVLAADGGNSKTIVAIADTDGHVLAVAKGGNTDIYNGAPEKALAEFGRIANEAITKAGVMGVDIAAGALSVAGADWPEDFTLLETELQQQAGLTATPLVINDALGCLRLASQDFEGIAVVCGTFNAVGARARNGDVFHCGFWPDRTGGYDLALEALRAVYREALDLGPSTTLTKRLTVEFDVADGWALMHKFNARGSTMHFTGLAAITPILLDEADGGDEISRGLVVQTGNWLGQQARVSAQRVGIAVEGAHVVFTGGVLNHPSTLIVDTAMQHLSGAVPTRPTAPPIVGALLLALDRAGATHSPDAIAAAYAKVDS